MENVHHIIYYRHGREGEAAQRICKSKGNRIEMDRGKTKKLGMGKKAEEESDGFRIFLCSENGRRINAESAHYFRSNT